MTKTDWTLGILVGGASRRMESDKAFLTVNGVTLLEYVEGRCRNPHEETILGVGHSDRTIPESLQHLSRVPDRPNRESLGGPLCGIEALLSQTRTTWLLVIPCDMPGLELDQLKCLMEDSEDFDSVTFEIAGEAVVLPMLIRANWARAVLPELLNLGKRRLVALLNEGRRRILRWPHPETSEAAFHNINTQSEFQAFLNSIS